MQQDLQWRPVLSDLSLVAPSVAEALAAWPAAERVAVAPIDPGLADTAEFCAHYGVAPAESANCVVIAGKREGEVRYAACLVLATTRADVNGAARRLLDVRKASFAPMAEAVRLSGMEYGGITPIGLPPSWPILVSDDVAAAGRVVIGSGLRASKLRLAGADLLDLPNAGLVPALGLPAPT
jgi:prolyl-tRNA editing enzyme YbaK/EbsC (Cys-tRNA(Pro) deacylase)